MVAPFIALASWGHSQIIHVQTSKYALWMGQEALVLRRTLLEKLLRLSGTWRLHCANGEGVRVEGVGF